MKTAMQELIEKLNNVKPTEFCSIETVKGWAESLLGKEKEQIINTYKEGYNNNDFFNVGMVYKRSDEEKAENYYNENYGKNK